MKIKNIYIILLALSVTLASCDKFLDKIPDSRVEVDSPEKITKLLVSAYPQTYWGLMLEWMSDNHTDNGPVRSNRYTIVQEAYLWQTPSEIGQDTPYWLWEKCYTAIATANLALDAIEKLGSEHDMKAQMGEALLCRAYGHWILANVFCMPYSPENATKYMGLPYSIHSESTVTEHYERGTLGELYANINADIEKGLPLINDNNYTVPKYHFNKRAAWAFAAELNLYMGNYDKTIEYANRVLGEDASSVLRVMANTRSLSTAGDIMYAYNNAEQPCNLMMLATRSYLGRCLNTSTNTRYGHSVAIWNGGTVRSLGPWSTKSGRTNTNTYLNGYSSYGSSDYNRRMPKCDEIFDVTDVANNTGYTRVLFTAFTTDRLMLCRAEAYIRKKMYDEAVKDLSDWYVAKNQDIGTGLTYTYNDIYNFYSTANEQYIKRPMTPVFPFEEQVQEVLTTAVLHARRIETVHEGIRWIDIKRYGIPVVHPVYNNADLIMEPGDLRYAVQLPEMVVNAGLTKNPR